MSVFVCTSYSTKWHTLRSKMPFFSFKIKFREESSSKNRENTHTRPVFEGYLFLHKNSPPLHFHLKVNFDEKNSLSEQIVLLLLLLFIFIACLLSHLLTGFVLVSLKTIRHTNTQSHTHTYMHSCAFTMKRQFMNIWAFITFQCEMILFRFKCSLQHRALAGKNENIKKWNCHLADWVCLNVLYSIFKWLHIAIMLTGKLICVLCCAVRHIRGKKPMQTLNVALVHFYC